MAPSVNSLLASVPKLSGPENFHDWKFGISMVLRYAEVFDITTTTPIPIPTATAQDADFVKKSSQALTIIGLAVLPTQYVHIRSCSTGPEAWQALCKVYERNSRAARIVIKRSLYGSQQTADMPMQEYITGVTDLAARLTALDPKYTMDDEAIVDVLLFNLHDTYSSIAATLTASTAALKVTDVTAILLDEEARILAANSGIKTERDENAVAFRADFTCYNCGKNGHMARNCRSPKSTKPRNESAGAALYTDDDGFLDEW